MGGGGLKLGIAAGLVFTASQLSAAAEQLVGRARESVQASELLMIDGYVHVWTIEQTRTRPPRDQRAFEVACREELSAQGRDVARDRWGEPYEYELVGDRPVRWRIASKGPDRRSGSEDDIVVERRGDAVTIDRDPVAIIERATTRRRAIDDEALDRLRRLAPARPAAKDDAAAWAALDAALGR